MTAPSHTPPPDPLRALRDEIERLQVRSAFQERVTQELSDQIYALHATIARLSAEVEALRRGAEGGDPRALPLGPALDRPPHY